MTTAAIAHFVFVDFENVQEVDLGLRVVEVDAGAHEALDAEAARQLVERVLELLSPPARLVITLQEIEGRSVKEVSKLTGWWPLVNVHWPAPRYLSSWPARWSSP